MSKSFFLFIAAGTLLLLFVMAKTGATLKTPATPHGILDLEMAYNKEKAGAVISAWKISDNIIAAKQNTLYDFIFIIFYSLFLYGGCRMTAQHYSAVLKKTGLLLGNGAIAAGLLDILENTGMLISLGDNVTEPVALFTVLCSAIKWILAITALLYFVIFGLWLLLRNITRFTYPPK